VHVTGLKRESYLEAGDINLLAYVYRHLDCLTVRMGSIVSTARRTVLEDIDNPFEVGHASVKSVKV